MNSSYRIAVLADIHGNLQALEAALADLENDQPLDGILVAGDIIAGPEQQRALQRLIDLHAVMIQGNNERAIARIAAGTAPEYVYTSKQYSLRRWAREHLDPEQVAFISSLPEQTVFHLPGADPIRIAHGSTRDINELVFPERCIPSLRKILKIIPVRPVRLCALSLNIRVSPSGNAGCSA
jgi:predicted phosphodiesterase